MARSQPNSRPVSLLVALPGEEDSLLYPSLPVDSDQGMKQSSTSTLTKVANSLVSRRNTLVTAPAVTITPAASIEALNRPLKYTTDQSSDDESTPLMSEMSSPTHTDHTNRGFNSPPSSDLSPASVKSTPTHERADGPQDYNSVCEGELKMSSRLLTSLSRQNAFDSEEEVQSPWSDPETTV